MIIYHLSGRQLRQIELGQGLQIAIPQSADCPYREDGSEELRQWYLDSLPDLNPSEVHNVRHCTVWVHATSRNNPGTLAELIGNIIDKEKIDRFDCFAIKAVAADIAIDDAARENLRLIRWPGGQVDFVRATTSPLRNE